MYSLSGGVHINNDEVRIRDVFVELGDGIASINGSIQRNNIQQFSLLLVEVKTYINWGKI